MCKMRVAINRLMLGQRELGWELWNGKEILELTSKDIENLIKAGTKVCGLTINENRDLVLDKDGFFQTNMTEHKHIGNYETMNESSTSVLYTCIGSHDVAGKKMYDCISSKFERLDIEEADMRAYLKLGVIAGGIKLDGDKLVVADLEFKKPEAKPAVAVAEPKKVEAQPEAKKVTTPWGTEGKAVAAEPKVTVGAVKK